MQLIKQDIIIALCEICGKELEAYFNEKGYLVKRCECWKDAKIKPRTSPL